MFLQAQAAFVTSAPALQCDVGVQRTVARAHSGVAADPITGDEMCRIRSDGAHPADCPGSRYHRQVQQVFALAAEDFVRIGQHAGCDDIDNDLAGPQHRVGQGLDGKWRSERPEDCSFHDDPAFWRGDHDRRLSDRRKAWYYPRIGWSLPSVPPKCPSQVSLLTEGVMAWRIRVEASSAIFCDRDVRS